MKAAIYARFSSEHQRETSTEDQLRLCRRRADALGATIVAEQSDQGVSGSVPIASRPGGGALLKGGFDILIVEALDRLSRDMVDLERTVRRLEHNGVRIIGLADGYDSDLASRKVMRSVRGLVSELYLDDLREKTHRGQAGQVSRGGHAGGLPYGYTTIEDGAIRRLQVVPEQAAIVRRIFAEYVAGESPRAIVYRLNAEGVPGIRGGQWAMSALYGDVARGLGMLRNPVYIGRYQWNRSRWVKDPDTGRRIRRERPQSEWSVEQRPDLAIVDPATWQAAQDRLATPTGQGGSRGRGRRPRTILSGLMRCGVCGGAYIATTRSHYGCGRHKDRGPAACDNRLHARRDHLEGSVIELLRHDLLSAESIDAARRQFRAEMAARKSGKGDPRAEIAAKQAEIARIADAIVRVGGSDALLGRLRRAEAELAALEDQAACRSIPDILPGALDRYRQMVDRLPELLLSRTDRARTALSGIIQQITMRPDGDVLWADLAGSYAGLYIEADTPGMVAGARYVTWQRTLRAA